MKGRRSEALRLMERVTSGPDALKQLAEIEASLHKDAQTWRCLLQPRLRRPLALSTGMAILIHFSGINTIIDYAPTIFESAGWKVDGALASTFLVGITELLFTILSLWLIDRYGRKPLYVIGSFGMALSLTALLIADVTGNFRAGIVLMLILLYLAFFASCIGPVFWTLVPEIFPNDVRGKAMTIPVLLQWIANAIVVLLFPYAFHAIGKVFTFCVLMLMALVQGFFTLAYIPETKNKSLEEIELLWGQAPSAKDR